ncbi:D-alanine--D-alanine ligase B [Sinobacterium norvegicum]|uniref:D-alanine--D-alanine ligase n=1 Tax=Sinobacterium norvegicum TaxID=1641715 RepID=A0ABN8ELE9_9GAMM|nr:D-alanine--D-alanine ligase [Sinobacterium norvegicum]CAH0993167.1 D-alanine--D-alanine ligase B [Sinobacterium norvegicum]
MINQLIAELKQKLTSPVAVLYGGKARERDVSLQSGAAVLQALKNCDIDCIAVDTQEPWVERLNKQGVAHSFIALHGIGGEDGTIQGALETLAISYTGSGVLASALGMDKLRCKHLWRGLQLPTADFSLLDSSSDFKQIMQDLGGKVMVKPALEGSSIGMSIAGSVEELEAAYALAGGEGAIVMAERWIEGREFTVAVLDGAALPAIELKTEHSFYDYDAKYISDDTQYICPAPLSDDERVLLADLAVQAFDSVGCRGWGRVDFMQDHQGRVYLLEVNTVPGMTSHSLVPMAAKQTGLDFESLVLTILLDSLNSEDG